MLTDCERREMVEPGQRFTRLKVLRPAVREDWPVLPVPGGYWLCECDCGTTKLVRKEHLLKGLVQSCKCLSRESAAERARARAKPKAPKAPKPPILKPPRAVNPVERMPNNPRHLGEGKRPFAAMLCIWCDQRLHKAAKGKCGWMDEGQCWWVNTMRELGPTEAMKKYRSGG